MKTQNTQRAIQILAPILAGLLLVPVVAGVAGGGTVSNKDPTVPTFAGAGTFNNPTTVILTGTIRDSNKEGDLATVKVATTSGPVAIDESYTILAADRTDTTTGAFSGTPGFDVYNSGASDGVLEFRFQFAFTVAGTYVIRAYAKDEGASFFNGPAGDLTVIIVDKITIAADPVSIAGAAQVGAAWGAWTALPAAGNVASVNYLKITNSGATATQQFTVDMASAFSGGGDSIAIDSNVQFACTETTTFQTPSAMTFTFGSTSASGSVAPSFSAVNAVIYCTYRLVALPDPLTDTTYGAAFTTIPA